MGVMPRPHERGIDEGPRRSSTERWARQIQRERWGRLTLEQRFRVFDDLCQGTHELSLGGLRLRHPAASDEELELRAACMRIGREALEKVLGRPLPFED